MDKKLQTIRKRATLYEKLPAPSKSRRTALVKGLKETDVQKAICDYLAHRKHFFWRNNNMPVYNHQTQQYRAMPKYSMKGVPDIIVVKDGWFVGLEVKMGSKQSDDQKIFEKGVKEAGGEYYVVRSIDDVKEIGL